MEYTDLTESMPPDAVPAGAMRSRTLGLVERASAGDAAAFESLLAARLDGLFRTAWAILGSESDAHDATQEAALSAWTRLPRLREPAAFDAWLSRILLNACRMRLRKRRHVRELVIDEAMDVPGTGLDDPDRIDDADLIARAFERLGNDARAVLVLHHLRHQPITSIAAALGVPEGTVKSRLYAARVELERALERERR